MNEPTQPNIPFMEDKTFVVLLAAVSLAFGWILLPFYGAVFWGVVLAILFAPFYRQVVRWLRGRPNLAAVITLAVIVLMVILPLALITSSLVREGAAVFQRIQSGEINFGRYFEQILRVLPAWVTERLQESGLGDFAALQQRVVQAATQASQFLATRALDITQNTLDFMVSFFITLYLAYFLIRDGSSIARRMWDAIPLDADSKRRLFRKFATVVRATVKGNILVAIAQGALGGLAFWFLGIHGALLWAVLMAFLSLLPAVGAALVWSPVAIYLLVTGELWAGLGLIAWGTLVIGLVDNVLRPVLVGKDIKMPDYLVLISTLGGLSVFGLNGFVIGPLIAAMFLSAWDIFIQAREEGKVGP